jgi:hypothetical protein
MPGLLRMAARTAVVAGTASAVSGRVQRRQAQRWAEPAGYGGAPAAPYETLPPEPQATQPAAADPLQQLKTLGELKAQGLLTDEEFATQKARILAG